jgi:glucose-1-phosphate thymidylyltransferase
MAVVGLIPAAGHATRLGLATGSKELVDVGGRPVMDYLVERLRTVTDHIVVITRPEKRDVIEHSRSLGLRVVEGEPSSVSESLLLGLSEADTVLFGFPDTIWEPVEGFAQLLTALDQADAVLGVFESQEPERSDVVVLDENLVTAVEVKPSHPRSNLIWGCAAARSSPLAGLDRHDQPGLLFHELAGQGRVRAVRFPGEMIDVGTPAALARARSTFG